MKRNNPSNSEFASWRSYSEFARRVTRKKRYVWDANVHAFLETVSATLKDRDVRIRKQSYFYRAQLGVDWRPIKEKRKFVGEEPIGYGIKRMLPRRDRATDGRVNPVGIPVLYLGSTIETAIAEIRPWVGSEVSVAQFKIRRDLKAVNLSLGHGKFSIGHLTIDELLGETEVTPEKKSEAVWIDIDSAFSRPITRSDDSADYVPTQILAEHFHSLGYDALVYRSQFGEKGYNIALFNLRDAEPINCAPYRVESLNVGYKEIGDRWFAKKHYD